MRAFRAPAQINGRFIQTIIFNTLRQCGFKKAGTQQSGMAFMGMIEYELYP